MTDAAATIRRVIGEFAGDFGVKADDKLFEALAVYATLLGEWNTVHNLTSVTNLEKVAVRHFLDSMALFLLLPPGPARILDVGTGAGFPGLVLALCRPELFVVAADATAKKVSFCKTVIAQLGLKNARAVQARLGGKAAFEVIGSGFDAAVSRASMDAPLLVKIAKPHLKDGGLVIAMKGEDVEKDKPALLQMAKKPGPKEPALELLEKSYTLPQHAKARWLLAVRLGASGIKTT
jgi:16S rRNA (guanine527-N7)-methyltransferase